MAVDLINDQNLITHTGTEGTKEMKNIEEQLIRILQSHNQQIQIDDDFALKKGGSQTGHARFRRANTSSVQFQPKSNLESKNKIVEENKNIDGNSSGSSSITGEEGKPFLSFPPPRMFSSGKPPLPTSHRKRCRDNIQVVSQGLFGKPSSCHCCKRRKMVIKREIKKVITTCGGSSKVAADDIPADKYSWKKYDQKLVPGTLFPRGYYKCNSVKGCPARKHVERDSNDPTVLILIYEGEHHHHHRSHPTHHHNRWMKMPQSLTRVNNNDNNSSGVGICC